MHHSSHPPSALPRGEVVASPGEYGGGEYGEPVPVSGAGAPFGGGVGVVGAGRRGGREGG